MDAHDVPKPARDKLLALSAQHEHLSEKAAHAKDAISRLRARLTGKFQTDAEYEDSYGTLKRLVADLPIIEDKRDAVDNRLACCQTWLDELPDDTVLEPVRPKSNGADLADVRERLRDAKDELETLAKVPVPSADVGQRVKSYVAALGRPRVSGVSEGRLEVTWPSDDATSLLAILMPDKMVEVILAEVERAANEPMPLDQRRKRMAELQRTIDALQRQAHALGDNTYMPAEVILGVRIANKGASRAA